MTMRVRLVFRNGSQGGIIPFHHQHLIAHFVEDIVNSCNLDESQDYHYNFSALKGKTKVVPGGLQYQSNRVTIVFASESNTFIIKFVVALFKRTKLMLGNLVLYPEFVEKEEISLAQDNNKYLCISPLVMSKAQFAKEDTDQFISPFSTEFSDILYDNTMTKMERSGNYSVKQLNEYSKFQVVPDKHYFERLKQHDKKVARIYSLDEDAALQYVRGYTFPFTLYAHPEVQKFIFNNGFGEYNQKGFGMVDFAYPDGVKKIKQMQLEEIAA